MNKIIQGDCLTELKKLSAESINCCMNKLQKQVLKLGIKKLKKRIKNASKKDLEEALIYLE